MSSTIYYIIKGQAPRGPKNITHTLKGAIVIHMLKVKSKIEDKRLTTKKFEKKRIYENQCYIQFTDLNQMYLPIGRAHRGPKHIMHKGVFQKKWIFLSHDFGFL